MTQIRRDPLTGDTILMACDRLARPNDFSFRKLQNELIPATVCPFCPQNESATLEPRFDYTPESNGPWVSRVVPNLFPALDPSVGIHRIVIESRRHVRSWSELTPVERNCSLDAYQDQLRQAFDEGYPYAQIFKNCGPSAGASLTHVHSQVIAGPQVPARVETELLGAVRHFRDTGRCFFCDTQNGPEPAAVVATYDRFTVVCPHASRFPFETWILPKEHQARFESITPEASAKLGDVLAAVIHAYEQVIPQVAYNWLLHTAPVANWLPATGKQTASRAPACQAHEIDGGYHWHLELLPRIAKMAGYEFATDQYINVVDPEYAAEQLSDALPA